MQDIFNDENLAELAYPFVEGYEDEIFSEDDVQTKISETLEDEEVLSNIETYFKHNFTQEDEFVINPLLVQKSIVKLVGYLFQMRNSDKIKNGNR